MTIRKGDLAIWREQDGTYRAGLVGSASRDGTRATSLLRRAGDLRWRDGWPNPPEVMATVPTDVVDVNAVLLWLATANTTGWTLEDYRVMVARFLRRAM